MIRKALYILMIGFLAIACTKQTSISVLCEQDKQGNYLLKWEIFPDVENIPIEIYMSENDEAYPQSPTQIVGSENYVAFINQRDLDNSPFRKFFKVKVEGKYSGVVSNRYFDMDSVQNFRDIGGYYTKDNRQVKWGKLFRSGRLKRMTERDKDKLKRMNVKTIFDLQSIGVDDNIKYRNYIRIPISKTSYSDIGDRIKTGRFLRGDAVIYSQDTYKDIVDNYTKELTQLFDYLCDEKNYPLVLSCYFGKDQTGLATYLLLRALDVSIDIAEDDYMRSNVGINKNKLSIAVHELPEPMQEAFTIVTKTDLIPLKYAVSVIRKKYGSVERYMETEIGLTNAKKEKLRDILLY